MALNMKWVIVGEHIEAWTFECHILLSDALENLRVCKNTNGGDGYKRPFAEDHKVERAFDNLEAQLRLWRKV